ncbi:carboxymuconolactone decarboxylase family protein [Bradyrhizobium sp. CCGUVB23]|uniref:carboxymuconolactone decarboxylase family protein n=1 Tax=Bradyrhizobium sp. CCGUVB23 TaxID=2949630 RepID=UPI0020B416E2|nr:hypothetical protein [Bradyrhizobium sp. CCGUVB23]MCP3466793.1 hypothetical protein [Bradyrhizobium sp. CCGUVB23]
MLNGLRPSFRCNGSSLSTTATVIRVGVAARLYEELRKQFTDKEIVDLTMLIGMINLWNRLAIGMRYVHDAG